MNQEPSKHFSEYLIDPHVYTHTHSDEDLREILEDLCHKVKSLKKVLTFLCEDCPIHNEFWKEIEELSFALLGLEVMIITSFVNLFTNMERIDPDKVIQQEIITKLGYEGELQSKDQLLEEFEKIHGEDIHVSTEVVQKFLVGKTKICTPSVYLVCSVAKRLYARVEQALDNVEDSPADESLLKKLLYHAVMLSKCFIMMYAASLDDPDDLLYQKSEESKEREMLIDSMEYHEPSDKEDHVECLNAALSRNKYLMGVASKAIMKPSKFCKIWTGLWYGMYYKLAQETGREQGMFTITMPNERAFQEGVRYKKQQALKAANAQKIDVEVHEMFYIPIKQDELITIETMEDTSQPKSYTTDEDWPIETNFEEYDDTEYIRARIVADFDYELYKNQKNPKIGSDVIEVEALILDFHGGAFMFGSTKKQLKYSQYFATKTEYPIVSLDYRLAPSHKFPSALNDCWQAYLWLLKNSEKYLKIKFNKIIIGGHSAGANLALGVNTLCIQKNVRKPDGLMLIYPVMSCTLNSFAPSLLLSLEDLGLNASLLRQVQENYIPSDFENTNHPLLSPKFLSDEILKEFPICQIYVGGLDPLRDDAIRFAARLLQLGVPTKICEYRYCLHGFMNAARKPWKLKECADTKQNISDVYIKMAQGTFS
ncbi:unnamed protein product [Moneuplotes crassus]|uniref:Alpha/beta hydrolase fold-3 domain-containing protein n=2 Tax=Euplotes crassus TaxID=5936 RepID=A0AAD1X7D8_EUPCR|nr:unnamed protein product [Moneuplotes crassus]